MYVVERVPLSPPRDASDSDVGYAVREGIQKAGWQLLGRNTTGKSLEAERRGNTFARVAIDFDRRSLSIRHLASSPNLKADLESGTIHKLYNEWVQNLEAAIVSSVERAAPFRDVSDIEVPAQQDLRKGIRRQAFSTSYKAHQQRRAYTGEKMIRVKEIFEIYDEIGVMRSPLSFTLAERVDGLSEFDPIVIQATAEYTVAGSFDLGRYLVVHVPGENETPGNYLIVDKTGSVTLEHFIAPAVTGSLKSDLFPGGAMRFYRPSPPLKRDLTFEPNGHPIKVGETPGDTNYQLVYNGTNGNQINIGYREFSKDDFARSAFYQDLVYRVDEKRIRFRELVIRVDRVSNEEIVYTVQNDPYADSELDE